MKELTYLIKDVKDKDDSFWFKFLEDLNRNKFVLEETLSDIFRYFKFGCDTCIIESTIEFEKFKCIYKSSPNIDDQLWCILKRKVLIEVAKKNQLQNITINKTIGDSKEVLQEFFYILPIFTKESIFYVIFDKFDSKHKSKYVLAFETLYCLFQTCEKNDLLSKYTMTDNITGCYNFNQFQKALGVEISKIDRAIDKDVIFSITLIEVEELTKINDKYGYTYGDMVLKTISKGIRDKIRNTDDAYRISGNKFCVINTYATKEVCESYILPRIIGEISKKIHIKDNKYYIPNLNIAIVQYRKGTTRAQFENLMEESLKKARDTKEIVVV